MPATPADMYALTGKTALVTGGSRGLGAAIAAALCRAGARVALAARTRAPLEAMAQQLRHAGGDVLPVCAHVGREDDVTALRDAVTRAWGDIDVLVNNAATSPHYGPLLDAGADAFQSAFNTNVLGYHRVARAFAPGMQARRAGKIINIASIAGHRPTPGLGVYGVTKAAVLMLTQTLAKELGADNIQVNAISPGLLRTDFSRALVENPVWSDAYRRQAALGRVGDTSDVTGLALYLASAASDYVTGGLFPVDGGYTL